MREILFRVKAINRDIGSHRTSYKSGDWVYGWLSRTHDKMYKLAIYTTTPSCWRWKNETNSKDKGYAT